DKKINNTRQHGSECQDANSSRHRLKMPKRNSRAGSRTQSNIWFLLSYRTQERHCVQLLPVCRIGVRVATRYRSGEAVAFADNGFKESGLLRVITQRPANLADSGVDAVIDINEDVLAPNLASDLLA